MAEHHSIKIPAHHNIYLCTSNRELRIDFCLPHKGVNSKTGLLILVPGFGAHIDSKVYRKMRDRFADQYNLVTIQCQYFGSQFMQGSNNFTLQNGFQSVFSHDEWKKIKQDTTVFFDLLKDKDITLNTKATLSETLEEFNDMSYMQAIDLITAVEAVKVLLKENHLSFNTNRLLGYGHSHGAYLLHLCNRLVPNLFSFIIDNSAWIEPVYLFSNRYLYQNVGKATLCIEFDYLAKKIIKNKHNLNLTNLYQNYIGTAQIITFQGNNDNLVDHRVKKSIIESLSHSKFILVTEQDIDHKKYHTNTHGLGADFLQLFEYAIEYESPTGMGTDIDWNYSVTFDGVSIDVSNPIGLPLFTFQFSQE